MDAYAEHGLKLWGLTTQNEPTDGYIPHFPFQAMGWYPEQQRDFVKLDLGPALHSAGYEDVKLMILDDQRLLLPYWADKVRVIINLISPSMSGLISTQNLSSDKSYIYCLLILKKFVEAIH